MGIFNNIQTRKPRLNKFDLSHEVKLSMKMGNLYPFICEDIVPGDKFKVNSEILLRLAPMISPVMHRVDVYTHYFFVPNRIIWNEWEDFITGGESGNLSPVHPTVAIQDSRKPLFVKGRLSDYLGLPPVETSDTLTETVHVSALPFRAYAEIYNEYFRDQNLEEAVAFSKGSGAVGTYEETDRLTTVRNRAWEKDYFTSALPWSQRGGEAQIPLGTVAPNYKSTSITATDAGGVPGAGNIKINNAINGRLEDANSAPIRIENLDPMNVDATTINDLRKANRLQQWLEKSARGGSRYIEQMLVHFGVKSSDARLQRPEYLGGGKQPVVISEVLSTAGTTGETARPQGDMAGHGISVGRTNSFNKRFEEHGVIMAIVSVLPKSAYQQGIERKWTKFDKFDHYWPEFAHLGEQEIATEELWVDYKTPDLRTEVFGYQQRYAEYKYARSTVHGDMRTNLKHWHIARIFDNKPALNQSFVMADDIRKDIFAVTDPTVDELYVQIFNKVSALRPMPYFSIPSL